MEVKRISKYLSDSSLCRYFILNELSYLFFQGRIRFKYIYVSKFNHNWHIRVIMEMLVFSLVKDRDLVF